MTIVVIGRTRRLYNHCTPFLLNLAIGFLHDDGDDKDDYDERSDKIKGGWFIDAVDDD